MLNGDRYFGSPGLGFSFFQAIIVGGWPYCDRCSKVLGFDHFSRNLQGGNMFVLFRELNQILYSGLINVRTINSDIVQQ